MNQLDKSLTISHVRIHKIAQFLSMKFAEWQPKDSGRRNIKLYEH